MSQPSKKLNAATCAGECGLEMARLRKHGMSLNLLPAEWWSATMSGVYFLCWNGVVVYVGQSVSLISRAAQHARVKTFDDIFAVKVSPAYLNRVEGFWIDHLRPRYNHDSKGKLIMAPYTTVRAGRSCLPRPETFWYRGVVGVQGSSPSGLQGPGPCDSEQSLQRGGAQDTGASGTPLGVAAQPGGGEG